MQKDHIKGLDGLRGIAAIAVFATHYDQIIFVDFSIAMFDLGLLFENGKIGVSLFFILSGFLLSLPFWDQLLYSIPFQGTRRYFKFRFARIIPAYYVCLTALLIINEEWKLALSSPDILLHYLFVFNLTEFSIFSFNSVFWTLAVEMQFYLILPILFWVLQWFKPRHTSIIVLSLIFTPYVIQYLIIEYFTHSVQWPWDNNLTWVGIFGAVISHSIIAHLPHFILGVFAGRYVKNQNLQALGKRWYELIFWLAVAFLFIILSTPVYDSISLPASRYGFPIVSILITLVIISCSRTLFAVKILDSFMFKQLGVISYGVYLYHLPVLNYLDFLMKKNGYDVMEYASLYAIISFLLTLMFALVSYYLVEQPILKVVRKNNH